MEAVGMIVFGPYGKWPVLMKMDGRTVPIDGCSRRTIGKDKGEAMIRVWPGGTYEITMYVADNAPAGFECDDLMFSSLDEAKAFLDDQLIRRGIRLIDDKEEADRLRLLL